MAFLPADNKSVSGAVCSGEATKPSMDGAKLYLNGGEDLNHPLPASNLLEKSGNAQNQNFR